MDQNRPMTKKELKALRRLEKLEKENSNKSSGSDKMKWIILSIGSVLFLAVFALIVFLIKQGQAKPVVISSEGWVKGSQAAKVTLVEFSDFQCPACKVYQPIVEQALKEFDGKLKLVYKHFPLASHKNGLISAKAAEAAGEQGKFFEMHDKLFATQEQWSPLSIPEAQDFFIKLAVELKLDEGKFKSDIERKDLEDKIVRMQNEGVTLGVSFTPSFFLNNKKLEKNPNGYPELKELIEEALK